MNEQNNSHSYWLPILGIGVLSLAGASVYEGVQTSHLDRQLNASQQDNTALRSKLSDTDAQLRKEIADLRQEVDRVREDAGERVAKAQHDTTASAQALVARMAKRDEARAKDLTDQLGQVRDYSMDASAKLDGKINGVSDEVGNVKTNVEAARTDIDATKSDLQRARGDMGVMSGLIATNGKQIQALRDLGDRNIYEFTIAKSGALQKVGDIQVVLRKTDPKHNRYTVEVVADDKRVEKKDRTINEPVQFYTSKARQPYELVVNQVAKDKIVGYLATPKVTVARNSEQ